MLSRGTSNASHRPQRAKSTSSIKCRAAEHRGASLFESENIHKDALTAATLAYERATQHQIDQKDALKRGVENDSGKAERSRPEIGRQKSIRFVGPNAIPIRTRSITCREAPSYSTSQDSNHDSLLAQMEDIPRHLSKDSITALPEGFNEDYVASEPSSYRKLRKAKSMFSPGKPSSTIFADRKLNRTRHFQRHSTQSFGGTRESVSVPDAGLRRSYSFLRGVTDRISIGDRQRATNDAAIQLARDTYLQQLEEQRLKEQPSFFNVGRRQKTQKAFRRTVRTSSTNSYGTAISSSLPSTEPLEPKGLSAKARTLSQAWKEKMKRVFKRSSNDGGDIPVQHLVASQPHYGSRTPTAQASGRAFSPVPEPDTELLHRVGSRESSFRSGIANVNQSSRPGSIRSVSSVDEDPRDKSRVTSWTNSTAATTINMPSCMERKRLSIITEDGGPHQSSSSRQQHGYLSDGYANFRQPIQQNGVGRLETQRIFFALQRQIDENNRKAAVKENEGDINRVLDQQRSNQPVSVTQDRSRNWPCVQYTNTAPDTRSGSHDMHVSNHASGNGATDGDVSSTQYTAGSSRDRRQQTHLELSEGLTPQQIADMNEPGPSLPKQPLREVRSAFFPPSVRIERRRASPYKQAMYASNKDQDATIRPDLLDLRALKDGRLYAGSVTRTESVYSRSSGGHDSQPGGSSMSLAHLGGVSQPENAVVISSPLSGNKPSARPFFPHRYSSADLSGEWKSFMASEVASLENDRRLHDQVFHSPSLKDSRHKRENAQLDNDNVEIGFIQAPNVVVKQPLRLLQGNALEQRRPVAGRSPSSDERFPPRVGADTSKENSPLRSPSISSQRHYDMKNENSKRGLWKDIRNAPRHPTCYGSLVSKENTNQDPVTSGSRYSPERTQRLRRLKSSSATMLRPKTSCTNPRENQSAKNSPGQQSHASEESTSPVPVQAGMNTKLVNNFLRERRRDMRISEESGTGPAFL